MTKIEELIYLRKKVLDYNETLSDYSVTILMKTYAEFYAMKCLDLAAENSDESPISIDLPEHE